MIITTISTKGGVGKTTILLGLAMILAKANKRTMLIDSDPNEPFDEFKNMSIEKDYWSDALHTSSLIGGDGLYLPIDEAISRYEDEGYEYILIDTKGGEGNFVAYAAQLSDIILIPSALTGIDMNGAEATLEWFEKLADRGMTFPPIKVIITSKPTKLNKAHERNLQEAEKYFPLTNTHIPYHAHIQNMSIYGLFHRIVEECRNSSDQKDRIQAPHFEKAMLSFEALLEELKNTISTEEAA